MSRRAAPVALALFLTACQSGPTKEELEAAKNTVDCQRGDERLVIRFDEGEARVLLPDGTRVILYQVPQAAGLRYTNGLIELQGRGPMDLTWTREGFSQVLRCKTYEIPKKE